MKKTFYLVSLIAFATFFIGLSSFKFKPRHHMIVGGWAIVDRQAVQFNNNKGYYIDQLTFGSDEFISSFHLVAKSKKEKAVRLAYRIYEDDKEFEQPLLVYKNTSDKKFVMVFTIERLTQDTLELKLQEKYTPKELRPSKGILKFERIAYLDESNE